MWRQSRLRLLLDAHWEVCDTNDYAATAMDLPKYSRPGFGFGNGHRLTSLNFHIGTGTVSVVVCTVTCKAKSIHTLILPPLHRGTAGESESYLYGIHTMIPRLNVSDSCDTRVCRFPKNLEKFANLSDFSAEYKVPVRYNSTR